MDPETYCWIAAGSIMGGFTGALVMWNRARGRVGREDRWRRVLVFALGTALAGCQLVAFTKALAKYPPVLGATVVMLVTSWVAVVQTVMRLPIPRFLRKAGNIEAALLRTPWIGVRGFGRLLRSTPLRRLGGRVYLSEAGCDAQSVLDGIGDAERVHLWALLGSVPWLVSWGLRGDWIAVASGLVVHLPLNVYPTLHLRYVAWRLDRHLTVTRRGDGG